MPPLPWQDIQYGDSGCLLCAPTQRLRLHIPLGHYWHVCLCHIMRNTSRSLAAWQHAAHREYPPVLLVRRCCSRLVGLGYR